MRWIFALCFRYRFSYFDLLVVVLVVGMAQTDVSYWFIVPFALLSSLVSIIAHERVNSMDADR